MKWGVVGHPVGNDHFTCLSPRNRQKNMPGKTLIKKKKKTRLNIREVSESQEKWQQRARRCYKHLVCANLTVLPIAGGSSDAVISVGISKLKHKGCS